MTYHPSGHCLAIPLSALPLLKQSLAIILGPDASPTWRLEIFSRLCGYRTWASLHAELKAADPAPVILSASLSPADAFLRGLPEPTRRRLARLGREQLIDLVMAGLDLGWSDDLGIIGFDETDTCETLWRHLMDGREKLRNFAFSTRPGGKSCLLISPENQVGLVQGANAARLAGGEVWLAEAPHWIGVELHLASSGRYFLDPAPAMIMSETSQEEGFTRGDAERVRKAYPKVCGDLDPARFPEEPEALLRAPGNSMTGSRIFFSPEDAAAFRHRFPLEPVTHTETLIERLEDLEQLKDPSAGVFEYAYYGMPRLDAPEEGAHGVDTCVRWVLELLNAVTGVDFEFERLVRGGAREAA